MDISITINQLITLFLLMAIGFLAFKIGLMNKEFDRILTKLVVNLTMPFLIINSVISLEEKSGISTFIVILVSAISVYLILPIIGFLIAKLLRVPKNQLGPYIFMTTYSNIGFMGFPLINALYGAKGVFYDAIFNIIFNLSAYSFGIILMNMGREDGEKFKAKQILSPGILLSLVGIALYFVEIPFPSYVTGAISYIGGLTTPLAMLLIGATLASMNLREIFNDWRAYPFLILKQLAIPLALFPLVKLLISDVLLQNVIVIVLSVPIANTSVLFATQYHGDEKLAARNVFLTTLLSVVTIPLISYICF